MHHPFRGDVRCEAADRYRETVAERRRDEADTLARLTGWTPEMIRDRMGPDAVMPKQGWWRSLWNR